MRIIRQNSEAERVESTGEKTSPRAQAVPNAPSQPFPSRPMRWMPQRKAEILAAVRRGSISLGQACEIYEISLEEFLTWQRADALYGLAGLRVSAARRKAAGADCLPKETPLPAAASSPAENA